MNELILFLGILIPIVSFYYKKDKDAAFYMNSFIGCIIVNVICYTYSTFLGILITMLLAMLAYFVISFFIYFKDT